MKAVISGQAGIALLIEGESLSSLHVGQSGEVIRRRLDEVRLLFGEARDLQFCENVSLEGIALRLKVASAEVDALHLFLILLDESLSKDTRHTAANELEDLLESEEIQRFLEDVLYSHPLPRGVNFPGVYASCTEHSTLTKDLLERLEFLQPAIAMVYLAWEQVPKNLFDGEAGRVYVQSVAVREGLFREVVLLRAANSPPEAFLETTLLNRSFSEVPHCRTILHEWLSWLRISLRFWPRREEIELKSGGRMSDHPRVFISYSHDSQEHRERVLEFAQQLRADGVDARLDRFEPAPTEGWPRWMVNQIDLADYVIVVGSPTYKRRFEGQELPGKGRGVSWEGLLVTQVLYETSGKNTKLVPLTFGDVPEEAIPAALRPYQYFTLPDRYHDLLRLLTRQPLIHPRPLGSVPKLDAQSAGSTGSGTLYPKLEIWLEGNSVELMGRLSEVQRELQRLTGSRELLIIGIEQGSTRLLITGPEEVIDKLARLIETGELGDLAGFQVLRQDRILVEPSQGPPWLDHGTLTRLFHVAEQLGLASEEKRVTLLSGLPPRIQEAIPRVAAGAGQLLTDLRFLNGRGRLSDGSLPIESWLDSAVLLSEEYEDSRKIREIIVQLATKL